MIQEGEKGNVFYIFESGQVEITQVDTDTKEDKHVRYKMVLNEKIKLSRLTFFSPFEVSTNSILIALL